MGVEIKITNNIADALAAIPEDRDKALEQCGSTAERYAKELCPVDSGTLRKEITHELDGENSVQVGTNVEYAAYVECGTGHYSTIGGGTTKESWVYFSEKDGKFHMGYPQKAQPYLKPAVADHTSTYKSIIENTFKGS